MIALNNEISVFESPEHVNNSKETAPSKRILKQCRKYDKPFHGSAIAKDIGLDTIRAKCHHFNGWMDKIEALALK